MNKDLECLRINRILNQPLNENEDERFRQVGYDYVDQVDDPGWHATLSLLMPDIGRDLKEIL